MRWRLPLVAAVCRRLDGLPLALELAANRVRGLGMADIAARLGDRFALLDRGTRGAPERQRTLRSAIDWSWELLTGAERAVLRRLAVFSGSFSLDAAEAVAADPNRGTAPDVAAAPGARPDGGADAYLPVSSPGSPPGSPTTGRDAVLEPLTRLVEHSLLAVETPGPPGATRYRMLESVAAYAAERLADAAEEAAARRRHLEYYTSLASRGHAGSPGPDQRSWRALLDRERPNLRAALRTAVAEGDAASALRLSVDLFWYRSMRGRHSEAHAALTTALAVDDEHGGGPAALRARARAFLVYMELVDRDETDPDPRSRVAEALAGFDGTGDEQGRSFTSWLFGPALVEHGEHEAAEAHHTRALAEFRAAGFTWGIAAALANRAYTGCLRRGRPAFPEDGAEAHRLFTELGDEWGQLEAMAVHWRHADTVGAYAEADRIAHRALALAEEAEVWPSVSYWQSRLAHNALRRGDLADAERTARRALRLSAEHGEAFGLRQARLALGVALRRSGSPGEAELHLRAWLGEGPQDEWTVDLSLALRELAAAVEARGDVAAARTLLRREARAARAR